MSSHGTWEPGVGHPRVSFRQRVAGKAHIGAFSQVSTPVQIQTMICRKKNDSAA